MGGIQNSSPAEIETVVRKALDHGINFFDLCAGGAKVYAPFGRAIAGRRNQVFFQLHFGAVYNDKGEYGWSRDLAKIQQTFNWELMRLGTNYVDMGFLHCVDEKKDVKDLVESGVLDYIRTLKKKGTVRHIGFSSHNPEVAETPLDTKLMGMMILAIGDHAEHRVAFGAYSQRAGSIYAHAHIYPVGSRLHRGGDASRFNHAGHRTRMNRLHCDLIHFVPDFVHCRSPSR